MKHNIMLFRFVYIMANGIDNIPTSGSGGLSSKFGLK